VVVWFNQRHLVKQLEPGTRLRVRGERSGGIDAQIRARSHELSGDDGPSLHTAGMVPVYPASERVSSRTLRGLADAQLIHAGDRLDPLPDELKQRRRLPLLRDALHASHQPSRPHEDRRARSRLAYDELLLLQLGLIEHRRAIDAVARARPLGRPGDLIGAYAAALPFALTGAQRRAIGEIDGDLAGERPMRRLLQGDVGSGKTAVAVHALLRAVERGGQGALMAPTETLATQHVAGVEQLLAPLGVRVAVIVNGMPARERRAALQLVESGEPAIVIGTHALIQDAVVFGGLAVAVVDEQHRFGVEQRRALEQKAEQGLSPHVLHMTATPIPRTLALTVYGDLDVSVLDELPPGRTPVVTRWLPTARAHEVFVRMRRLLDGGRQAYVVCPLVAESEGRQAAAAETEAARLAQGELRGYRVECLHGQMPAARRHQVMSRFRAGEVDVLVATTVIEVGVDVENAVLMVIEGADLFGLAQLHQLRGRVGRGGHESYCMLIADPGSDEAAERLRAMVATSDGFRLAEVDLELRGEGALMAARQSGLPDLRHAGLRSHRAMVSRTRRDALALLDGDRAVWEAVAPVAAEGARRLFGAGADWAVQA
jgi:ATP-dependent DNA helicase RecG